MGVGMMAVQKPKSFRKTLRTFIKYLAPYKVQLIMVFVFAIASTAFMIVGPKMLGWATTRLFEGVVAKVMQVPGAAIDYKYIGTIALVLLALYLASAAFSYLQSYIMAGVSMKITYTFRRRIAEKIKRIPLKYFDTKTHGEALSLVTNDIDTISNTLTQNLSQIVTSVTTIIGILVMMLTISWLMTMIALVIIPVSLGLVTVVIKASQKYFKSQQDYLGHVNGHVEETYGGHTVIKAFNGEARAVGQFDEMNDVLYRANWKGKQIQRERNRLQGELEITVPFRHDDAHHELREQSGLCRRSHPRRVPGDKGFHRRGRYPRFHPVRPVFHPAYHADRQYRQRAPGYHGRRRTRLRVSR